MRIALNEYGQPTTPPQEWWYYDNQPFNDLTGVPDDVVNDPDWEPVPGTQHFDADGSASISTVSVDDPNLTSGADWDWTEYPPAVNAHLTGALDD